MGGHVAQIMKTWKLDIMSMQKQNIRSGLSAPFSPCSRFFLFLCLSLFLQSPKLKCLLFEYELSVYFYSPEVLWVSIDSRVLLLLLAIRK